MSVAMCGYRFFGATVAVTSDQPLITQWLDEFLAPAFEPWTGAAELTVTVRTDPAPYAALVATRPPGALADEPCFALDTRVDAHPAWRAGVRTVLADAKYGALYALEAGSAEVLAAPESSLFRGGVMRVVREAMATRALLSDDRIQLHAAACEVDGRAVLIAGPKSAGKTTLLAYLTASTGARLLGNDRAVAERDDGGFVVRAVPTLVSVRPETRFLVPRVYRGMTLERPAHLTAAELDRAMRDGAHSEVTTRLRLSPAQLARQLGVALAAAGRLAAIVFPAPARPDELAIERLPADAAGTQLHPSRFGTSSGKQAPTVFERLLPRRRSPQADEPLLDAIARRIPCFSTRIGRERFATPHAAAALLDAVLERSEAA